LLNGSTERYGVQVLCSLPFMNIRKVKQLGRSGD